MTCTFFGHRDCKDELRGRLTEAIERLINEEGVDRFLVGNNGNFDAMVYRSLCELGNKYPNISFSVVLAYMPANKKKSVLMNDTILPEGIEKVPGRFAIAWRNRWMVSQSDYAITYVVYSWGGAASFAELAAKKCRKVINIADDHV